MDLHIMLFLLLLFLSGSRGDTAECQTQMQRCMEPVVEYVKSMQGGRFVPYMTDEQFNGFCRKYDEVDECLHGVKCDEIIKAAFEGKDDAMEFMCNEEPEGYQSYASCITDPLIHTEMQSCLDIVHKMKSQEESCRLSNEFLHCGYNVLEDHCSADEAFWFEEVLVKSTQPIMNLYDCEIDRPSKKSKATKAGIIGGVVATILIVMIIAVVVAVVYYKQRKHKTKGYKPTSTKSGIV